MPPHARPPPSVVAFGVDADVPTICAGMCVQRWL